MKKSGMIVCLSLLLCAGPTVLVGATNTSTFKVQILPLECSFDTTAIGQTTSQQLTPEACLPFSGQILSPIVPVVAPAVADEPLIVPASPLAETPLLVVSTASGGSLDAKRTAPLQTSTSDQVLQVSGGGNAQPQPTKELPASWQPVILAIAVTAFAVVPGTTLAPIVAQAYNIRPRFPWVK